MCRIPQTDQKFASQSLLLFKQQAHFVKGKNGKLCRSLLK